MATSTLTATNHYTTFLNTEMSPTSAYAWKRTDLARQGAYHDSSISTDEGESQLGIIQFSHGLAIHPSQITAIKIKATYSGGSGAARKIKFYQSLKSLDTSDNNGSHYLGSELGTYSIGSGNNQKTISLTSGTLFNNLKKYLCRGTNSFAICTYNEETCGTSGTTHSTNYVGLKAVSIEVTYTNTSYTITVNPAGGTMTYLANGSTTTTSTSRTLQSTVPYFPISTDGVTWGISVDEYDHKYYQGGQFICGEPTRSGYTFKGWSSSYGTVTQLTNVTIGGITYGAINSLANPKRNVTITAVWESNTVYYTVTYNANGGSRAPSSQEAAANTNITLSTTSPTRSGYTFLGWSTSSKAQKDEYHSGDSYKVTANCTLYAVWAKNISLNSSTTVTVGYGDDLQRYIYTPSSNVTAVIRSNYSGSNNPWLFLYTKKGVNGGGTWIDGGGTGNNFRHSQTFSAGQPYVFETCFHNPQTGSFTFYFGSIYTITFEKNTTDTVSNMPGTYNSSTGKYTGKKDYGFSYTIPNVTPTRSGYMFLGWSTNSGATSGTYAPGGSYSSNSNTTLYAIWQSSSRSIDYVSSISNTQNMPDDTTTTSTSYTLSTQVPWVYNKAMFGYGINSTALSTYPGRNITVSGNTTVNCLWESPTTITTNSVINNRDFYFPQQRRVYSFTPTETRKYRIFAPPKDYVVNSDTPNDPDLYVYTSSYTTSPWAQSSQSSGSEDSIIATFTQGTTYYIHFVLYDAKLREAGITTTSYSDLHLHSIYNISYDANGGSGAPDAQEKIHGTNLTLSSTVPTRTGYVFLGWATSNTATSATYSAGGTYSSEGDEVLYAVWQAKKLTVIYHKNNPDGTTESTATQVFTYDSVGTRRFGYIDNSNNKKWTAPNDYAAAYGFGEWYFPGYKIIGWGDSRTAVAYTENAPYNNVSNDWINKNVGDAATGTKDIYAIWDYNGVVRIYYDGEWKYAIPYIYNGSSWQYGVPYIYKNSTDGWKMST